MKGPQTANKMQTDNQGDCQEQASSLKVSSTRPARLICNSYPIYHITLTEQRRNHRWGWFALFLFLLRCAVHVWLRCSFWLHSNIILITCFWSSLTVPELRRPVHFNTFRISSIQRPLFQIGVRTSADEKRHSFSRGLLELSLSCPLPNEGPD